MSFDPTNFNPSGHGGGDGELLPAGIFVLWVRSFKRKQSNGKDQILFIIDAVLTNGQKKIPKDRFQPVFETVTLTEAAAWRLADLCRAVGRTTPFNVMSDVELSNVMKFKPFKAKLKRETYQGREGVKIDGYLEMNNLDERAADEVLEDRSVDQAAGGYDEFDPGASQDRGRSTNTNNSVDFDDDIPF